jgi:lipoprotein-anchoring transpeptidase ErfK/SrfK
MGQPGSRIRYKRLTAVGASCAITAVALLGGAGVLPAEQETRPVAQATLASAGDAVPRAIDHAGTGPATDTATDTATPGERGAGGTVAPGRDEQQFRSLAAQRRAEALEADALAVPDDSGEGRRVVFDQSAQRVWLVGGEGRVQRTYLVSGSVEDNLDPGSYEVYSRSKQAWGIDDGGTMKYMVRFTYGKRAAIGFHDIPIKDGVPAQTEAQLGTPLSHGCVRQRRSDAIALWKFAPLGTSVIVTA